MSDGRYRGFGVGMWSDERLRSLTVEALALYPFVRSHPQMLPMGCMRASAEGLAAELGSGQRKGYREAFREAFSMLVEKGLLIYDEDASFVAVPVSDWMIGNRPASPKAVKGWGKHLDVIPKCRSQQAHFHSLRGYLEGYSQAFFDAFPEAFVKAMPSQEAGKGNQESLLFEDPEGSSEEGESETDSEPQPKQLSRPQRDMRAMLEAAEEAGSKLPVKTAAGALGKRLKKYRDRHPGDGPEHGLALVCGVIRSLDLSDKDQPLGYLLKALDQRIEHPIKAPSRRRSRAPDRSASPATRRKRSALDGGPS